MSEYERRLREFKKHVSEMESYDYLLNTVLAWERTCVMPRKSREFSNGTFEFLGQKLHLLGTTPEFLANMDYLHKHPRNDWVTNSTINSLMSKMKYLNDIPKERYGEYLFALSRAEENWEAARKANDFNLFAESLDEIILFLKEFATYWGYENNHYEGLISSYIDGCSASFIEEIVTDLKEAILPQVKHGLKKQQNVNPHIKEDNILVFTKEEQEDIWNIILEELGFDFSRGMMKVGPYTTIFANSTEDVRLVNSYSENDVFVGIFNLLHSGGKAIYHQSIDKKLLGTMLADPPSGVIKEGIGRLYENIIGKSRGFWERVNDKIKVKVDRWDFTVDEIEQYVLAPKVNLNRLESDEVTYLIHVIIRYEIECELINGHIKANEVKELWKAKYKEYLDLEVSSDVEGVLQDVHWALGYVGYFPTYLIANMISAQLARQMYKELGDLNKIIAEDGLGKINQWLKDNIYVWGARYSTVELINKACREKLTPQYYIEYLQTKYL